MYACICNAVTEREVRRTIENGATTMRQLKEELNIATNCGSCAEGVEQYLQNVLADELSVPLCAVA